MDNRGRELDMTWAFFFAHRACVCRAIAHGVSGISGFGLGCQLRRVGIWGLGWGLGVLNFGGIFLGILEACFW